MIWWRLRDLNCYSSACKAGAFSTELIPMNGAGDGIRTRDIHVGNVMLYQLSYSRICDGATCQSRTDDLRFTKPLLYPTELKWHSGEEGFEPPNCIKYNTAETGRRVCQFRHSPKLKCPVFCHGLG